MDLQTIISTERRLLEPICSFERHSGYTVYRSDSFPNYYGGNGIELDDTAGRSLGSWEETFRHHFSPYRFVHTTFTFAGEERFRPLTEQAQQAGYHVETSTYMFADTTAYCRELPEGLEVRKIRTEEDWMKLWHFQQETYIDGDWYDPNATGPDRLFEKTRFTSGAVGIEWLYLARRGRPEILSKLGIFRHNGICRLQDVETGKRYRRQGFASALVSHAIRHALTSLGTRGLALCADSDYHAIDLYRKLGFLPVGNYVTLMNYPILNPLFLEGSS